MANDVTMTEARFKRLHEAEALIKAEAKIEREMAAPGEWLMAREEAKAEARDKRALATPSHWEKLKGRYQIEGAKPILMDVGKAALRTAVAGMAIYYAATSDWFDKIELFRDHWWLKSVVVMALGYWLYQRQSQWAGPVIAAGAAMFVEAWRTRPVDATKAAKAKADAPKAKTDTTTQGPDEDAGHWDWVDDTYGRRGRWVETPNGGRSYITQGHGAHAAERIAERVFEHARPA
jgi:hypothetical protein